jgi:hypothetical protein
MCTVRADGGGGVSGVWARVVKQRCGEEVNTKPRGRRGSEEGEEATTGLGDGLSNGE